MWHQDNITCVMDKMSILSRESYNLNGHPLKEELNMCTNHDPFPLERMDNSRGKGVRFSFVATALVVIKFIPYPILVAICSTFVKSYQGRITLSYINATKVHTNIDIPSVVEMQERYPYATPPSHIHIPAPDNRKTISQLLLSKGPSCQVSKISESKC